MRTILIRHPVTTWNLQGKIQPAMGGDISPQGYLQVEKLRARLLGEKIDAVYSSDSPRCLYVASQLAKDHHTFIIPNPVFRERFNGVFEGAEKTSLEEELNKFEGEYIHAKVKGGESFQEVYDRAVKGLNLITKNESERVVLVSHGSFLKMFLAAQLKISLEQAGKLFKFSNCAISETRQLDSGAWMVEYLNNRDYLSK